MNNPPFFIYAGPPKTGSTWLYVVLDEHPDVQLPMKELKYFEIKDKVGNVGRLNRLFGTHAVLRRERRRFLRRIKKAFKPNAPFNKWRRLYNLFRYFFADWNDTWYQGLFPPDKFSGDISPNYCSLSEDAIKHVKALNPNIKIIIGLRDPIEKRWSDIRMQFLRIKGKKRLAFVNQRRLTKALHSDSPDYDDYTLLLDKWYKHFDAEQILVYYFEEIKENPQQLYQKICTFLELPAFEPTNLTQIVNQGIREKPTLSQQQAMISSQYAYIEKFAKHYPNDYSLRWLAKYRKSE